MITLELRRVTLTETHVAATREGLEAKRYALAERACNKARPLS